MDQCSTTLVFEIPGLRLKTGLNAREHWRSRAQRVAKERRLTSVFARAILRKNPILDSDFPIVIQITRVGSRKVDDDNLAGGCKAVRDQIAVELGVDDGDPSVSWVYKQEKGRYAVIVSLMTKTRLRQELIPA